MELLLKFLPQSVKLHLSLQGIEYAFNWLEAEHAGRKFNVFLEQKYGPKMAEVIRQRGGKWLDQFKKELTA